MVFFPAGEDGVDPRPCGFHLVAALEIMPEARRRGAIEAGPWAEVARAAAEALPHPPPFRTGVLRPPPAPGRDAGLAGGGAVDAITRIVRRCLADHRHLFAGQAGLKRDLVDVLDAFVRAGWPEAVRLGLDLGEIY